VTAYLVDAASFQGDVNWDLVASVCAGGMEKVTEGTSYTNPNWPRAKAAFLRLAPAFTGAGYLFLSAGNGAGQARFFARQAGNLDSLGLVVDCEPTATSRPTLGDLRSCVAELRQLYPGKPVGGYIPHWYWGEQDTTMVDYLWASNYVTGTGAAAALYRRVTPGQWAGYGGLRVAVLQFTSTAVVPGVAGPCDCSAYEGRDLRGLLTGAAPIEGGAVTIEEAEPMWLPNARAVPVALSNEARRLRFAGLANETIKLDWLTGTGPDLPTATADVGYTVGPAGVPVPDGAQALRVVRGDLPDGETDYPPLSLVILT
jgi:lysozyme